MNHPDVSSTAAPSSMAPHPRKPQRRANGQPSSPLAGGGVLDFFSTSKLFRDCPRAPCTGSTTGEFFQDFPGVTAQKNPRITPEKGESSANKNKKSRHGFPQARGDTAMINILPTALRGAGTGSGENPSHRGGPTTVICGGQRPKNRFPLPSLRGDAAGPIPHRQPH